MYTPTEAVPHGLGLAVHPAGRRAVSALFRPALAVFCFVFGTLVPALAGALPPDSLHLDFKRDLAEQLLPFEEIYQLAVKNSPQLKEELTQAETKIENVPLARTDFLHGLSLLGNYTVGNQSLVSNGTTSFDYLQVSNGYRVGIQAMIPVQSLLSRRPRVRQAQAEYRVALARAEVVKLTLRRELNKVYYELLTSQRVLNVYLQDEQAALVAFRSVELDWQQGRATVQDYSAASRVYTDIRIKVEGTRGSFFSFLHDLTALVGVEIHELKR